MHLFALIWGRWLWLCRKMTPQPKRLFLLFKVQTLSLRARLVRIFLFWSFKKWEINSFEIYFQVLTLLSHTSQVDVTYKRVTQVHMARLTFTWTLGVTSIWMVPPHLLVSKMSHSLHTFWGDSFYVKISRLFSYHLQFFYN
jgi:hypothetical protein